MQRGGGQQCEGDGNEDGTYIECMCRTLCLLANKQIKVKVERMSDSTTPSQATPLRKTIREATTLDDLPQQICALWTTKFIPTLNAYNAHHATENPFVIPDMAKQVQDVFRKVYPQCSKLAMQITPGTAIYKLVSLLCI